MAKPDLEYVRGFELAVQSQAAGVYDKLANEPPQLSYALTGTLYASSTGWVLLSVPNALGRSAFDAITEPGIQLPVSGTSGRYAAHISVIRPEELEAAGLTVDQITERGHRFPYTLGPLKTVAPANWAGISRVWFIEVVSPALEKLRKSYGLTALPKDNEFKFHITVAIRRKGVLQPNELSKAGTSQFFRAASEAGTVESPATGTQIEKTAEGSLTPGTATYNLLPAALLAVLGGGYGAWKAPGGSPLRGAITGGLAGAGAGLGYSAADSYLRSPYGKPFEGTTAVPAAMLFGALGLGGSAGLHAGRRLSKHYQLGDEENKYENDLAAIDPAAISRKLLPSALQPYAVKAGAVTDTGRDAVRTVPAAPTAPKPRKLNLTSLLNLRPLSGSRTVPLRQAVQTP